MPAAATSSAEAGMPLSDVTAVVLVHEDVRHLDACLRALAASRGVRLRLLVVDNGSSPNARAAVHETVRTVQTTVVDAPPITVHETGANLGYAGGNNAGITVALAEGARHVLVVNDDTVIAPEAIARLAAALAADPRGAAASPSMVYAAAPTQVWWAGGEVDRLRAIGRHETATTHLVGPPRVVGCLCGCAMLFRAEALEALGPFDASYFMYGEDVEWSVRAVARGWRLWHVPAARLAHAVPFPEPPPAAWKIRLRDRNRRRMARRHFSAAERARFLLWFVATRLVRLGQAVVVGDVARARALVRGMTER